MAPPNAPNILILMAEDTGRHQGCYGDRDGSTPHLDRLATEGVRFANALSTAPVCAPARSSVVTGRYPWSLGTLAMRSTLLHPPRLLTHRLRDRGYYVNWFTKTDFNFDPPNPPAPDPFCDEARPWLEDLAQGRLAGRPWLLYQNFFVTHESTMWDGPLGQQAGARAERIAHDHLLVPHQHHRPETVQVPPYLPDTPAVRQCLARYYDALSIQDAQIGQVLDALERSGQAENTLVIYLSDHGRGLPREKRWCYNAGIHQPLIIRWPGHLEPGTVSDEIVSWVDIAPTLLKVAGADDALIASWFQGRAFLGEKLSPPRQFAFAARDRMDETYDSVRVARDSRFHYIRNRYPRLPYAQRNTYMEHMPATQDLRQMHAQGTLHGPAALWMADSKPPEELYDWRHDPHMIHNLAGEPAFTGDLQRLRAALDEHLAALGDLHLQPERELIAQGLVKDRLAEFRAHIQPLPQPHRIGPPLTVLEMAEAEAYEHSAPAP